MAYTKKKKDEEVLTENTNTMEENMEAEIAEMKVESPKASTSKTMEFSIAQFGKPVRVGTKTSADWDERHCTITFVADTFQMVHLVDKRTGKLTLVHITNLNYALPK